MADTYTGQETICFYCILRKNLKKHTNQVHGGSKPREKLARNQGELFGKRKCVESIISKYSIHNSKIRPVSDNTANNEMFIAVNGPELGEADGILAKALDLKFGRNKWRHCGIIVEEKMYL